jgi:hypothetical protein
LRYESVPVEHAAVRIKADEQPVALSRRPLS